MSLAMSESWRWLVDTADFTPRADCGPGWVDDPWLISLSAYSDWGIFFLYSLISATLALVLYRSRRRPFARLGLLFAGFIFFCGLTHGIASYMFEFPVYRLAAFVKFLTLVVTAAAAAGLLVNLVPVMRYIDFGMQLEKASHLETSASQIQAAMHLLKELKRGD